MVDITPIVEAVIGVVVAICSVFVIPWLKSKVSAEKMETYKVWVEIGVAAAEQLYKAADGAQKKLYVQSFLFDKGIKLDEYDLDNLIESAVLKLHNELYGTEKVIE